MVNQQTIELIETYKQAIENEDYDTAADAISDLSDHYDKIRTEEKRLESKAKALRDRSSVDSEDGDKIEAFLRAKTAVEFQRNALLTGSMSLILGSKEIDDPGGLASTATDLKDQEQNLSDATDSAKQTVEDSNLPPSISMMGASFTDPIQPAEQIEITVRVENTGDQAAEDVEITVDTEEGVSESASSKLLGTVASNDSTEQMFEMQGQESGRHRVTFELTSSNAGSDLLSTDVIVSSDEEGGTPWFDDYTRPDGVVDSSGLNTAIQKYLSGDLGYSKLNAIIQSYLSGNPVEE